MILRTEVCSLLDIKYPILQGGMAWVATGELAAAVSKAGALGIIGAGNAPAGVIKREIRKVKERTDNPFAVNVMLLSPCVEEIIELVIEEEVPVVTTGAGNPGKYIDRFLDAGIITIPIVPSVALARRMERSGAEALIVEGHEAGGHVGKMTTMALIPQVVDAVEIPVIAAGGIADGRGLVAALSLGAAGVQMGTRFVCTEECTASTEYKQAIIGARDRDAIVTGRSTGHPVRNIKNKLTRKIEKMERQGAPLEEIEKLGTGRLRQAVCEGDVDYGSVMAGQISGMINDILPVRELIENITGQAGDIINNNCYLTGGCGDD